MFGNQRPKSWPESRTSMVCRSLDVSWLQGKGDGFILVADPLEKRRQPPLVPGDSMLTYSQNVAGLWLKYGAKSLKIEASSQCKILPGDATIC
jgi:hypothetical protein